MLFDKSAILTVQNHVITRNPRISVSHDKHRTWFLHINDVHEEDKGKYMCQINTAAAKTQYGYLHVVGKTTTYAAHIGRADLWTLNGFGDKMRKRKRICDSFAKQRLYDLSHLPLRT